MTTAQPTFLLNADTAIPAVGFGTYLITGEAAPEAVSAAIAAGYRHIDTASGYRNEVAVGEGIAGVLRPKGLRGLTSS